jgi:hypothetical protein
LWPAHCGLEGFSAWSAYSFASHGRSTLIPEDKPEIIVDEGWKAQVEKERSEQPLEPEAVEPAEDETGEKEDLTIFESLLSSLAAQTMMALGLVAPEGQEQITVDLGFAQHMVATLMMLQEKTKGNLLEQEEQSLDEAVRELQKVFAMRVQQYQETSQDKDPGPGPIVNP